MQKEPQIIHRIIQILVESPRRRVDPAVRRLLPSYVRISVFDRRDTYSFLPFIYFNYTVLLCKINYWNGGYTNINNSLISNIV